MEGFVDDVFKACDKVEEELGPADPEGKTKGKVYPAVSCNGVGHKSTRYFGLYYYLVSSSCILFAQLFDTGLTLTLRSSTI